MRLPGFKRIYASDFDKSAQAWIDKLAFIINNGVEVLYQTLNNNVSVADNLFADVMDVNVVVADDKGTVSPKVSFTLKNIAGNPILGLIVINATNNTNSSIYPTTGIFCAFQQQTNTVNLLNIQGLPVNTQFTLRLLVLGAN